MQYHKSDHCGQHAPAMPSNGHTSRDSVTLPEDINVDADCTGVR